MPQNNNREDLQSQHYKCCKSTVISLPENDTTIPLRHIVARQAITSG